MMQIRKKVKDIKEIAKYIDVSKPELKKQALEDIQGVPEHDLYLYRVASNYEFPNTLSKPKQTILLAEFEINRRANFHTRWLAISTTFLVGIAGLISIAFSVYLSSLSGILK